MSAPIIPLNKELDTLIDIKSVAESSFQQCKDMVKDFLMYSSDIEDLQILKEHMNSVAVSQKEISGLIHATNQIDDLTGRVNLTESEVTTKFVEGFEEYIEENDIDDTQEDVLISLDSFINDNKISDLDQGEDNDLLVTKTALSYKDTLTQRIIQDPVKSKICKHSYERETIMAYLADKNKKCPFSGCQSKLSRMDLVDDFVLKVKLSLEECS